MGIFSRKTPALPDGCSRFLPVPLSDADQLALLRDVSVNNSPRTRGVPDILKAVQLLDEHRYLDAVQYSIDLIETVEDGRIAAASVLAGSAFSGLGLHARALEFYFIALSGISHAELQAHLDEVRRALSIATTIDDVAMIKAALIGKRVGAAVEEAERTRDKDAIVLARLMRAHILDAIGVLPLGIPDLLRAYLLVPSDSTRDFLQRAVATANGESTASFVDHSVTPPQILEIVKNMAAEADAEVERDFARTLARLRSAPSSAESLPDEWRRFRPVPLSDADEKALLRVVTRPTGPRSGEGMPELVKCQELLVAKRYVDAVQYAIDLIENLPGPFLASAANLAGAAFYYLGFHARALEFYAIAMKLGMSRADMQGNLDEVRSDLHIADTIDDVAMVKASLIGLQVSSEVREAELSDDRQTVVLGRLARAYIFGSLSVPQLAIPDLLRVQRFGGDHAMMRVALAAANGEPMHPELALMLPSELGSFVADVREQVEQLHGDVFDKLRAVRT